MAHKMNESKIGTTNYRKVKMVRLHRQVREATPGLTFDCLPELLIQRGAEASSLSSKQALPLTIKHTEGE
ncbi:unnamed protein product [Brassica oleracea]